MSYRLTLEDRYGALLDPLTAPNEAFARRYPGEPEARQPVHVVYGGAQSFSAELPSSMGEAALALMDTYAPDPLTFARAVRYRGSEALPLVPAADEAARLRDARQDPERARREDPAIWLALTVFERVREKLEREPVEDYRIDFEDGFGVRSDEEEDRFALQVGAELARTDVPLPAFVGVRIKPLNEEHKARALRTLDLLLTRCLPARAGAGTPFFVTLPKVTSAAQVAALAGACDLFEERLALPRHTLRIELMIELTQSVFAPDGRLLLPALVEAGRGRVSGAHFGTYDYTACNAITAAYQGMAHPACQHALRLMKVAYANTEIFLSDGSTNVMPVPVHVGDDLTDAQRDENRAAVHNAWQRSAANIQRSLEGGYFQGWDLHAGQLVSRYAATFAFFLGGFDAAADRLRTFLSRAKEATLIGDVFDDAATGQALLSFFLRAQASGAVSLAALAETGLTEDEIEGRSFKAILRARTRG